MRLVLAIVLCAGSVAHAADVIKGQQIYRRHCASCHGQNGISAMPTAPSFARGEGLMRPDAALTASIRSGRGNMPAYFGILSDREILDVVAYMRSFR